MITLGGNVGHNIANECKECVMSVEVLEVVYR